MDLDNDGAVTKTEFLNFLRDRPMLQNILLKGVLSSNVRTSGLCRDVDDIGTCTSSKAVGIKRILKLFKNMDSKRTGSLQWEEFMEFFRRAGLLLEYATVDNPRDRMAAVLGEEHRRRQLWAKWQKAGTDAAGLSSVGMSAEDTGVNCQYRVDQKRTQIQAEWVSEHVAKLSEQHQQGRDSWSVCVDTCNGMRSKSAAGQRPAAKKPTLPCLEALGRRPPLAPRPPITPRSARSALAKAVPIAEPDGPMRPRSSSLRHAFHRRLCNVADTHR